MIQAQGWGPHPGEPQVLRRGVCLHGWGLQGGRGGWLMPGPSSHDQRCQACLGQGGWEGPALCPGLWEGT